MQLLQSYLFELCEMGVVVGDHVGFPNLFRYLED